GWAPGGLRRRGVKVQPGGVRTSGKRSIFRSTSRSMRGCKSRPWTWARSSSSPPARWTRFSPAPALTASTAPGKIGAGGPADHSRRGRAEIDGRADWRVQRSGVRPQPLRSGPRVCATGCGSLDRCIPPEGLPATRFPRAASCLRHAGCAIAEAWAKPTGKPCRARWRAGEGTMAAVPFERIDAGAPQAASANAILIVDDIVKRFETPDGVLTAVDHVSLSVAPGEFVGVIGPSGCGKSTLFNVIGGLLDGYDGAVKVAGERVRGPHPAIGMIFQEESTFPWRNVIDNVAF